MAAPVWLSSAVATPLGACVADLALAFAGIIILGIADSAASAVGRRFGRRRILGTRKTLEGTLGGITLTLAAWVFVWPLCGCRGSGRAVRWGAGGAGSGLGAGAGAAVAGTLLQVRLPVCKQQPRVTACLFQSTACPSRFALSGTIRTLARLSGGLTPASQLTNTRPSAGCFSCGVTHSTSALFSIAH